MSAVGFASWAAELESAFAEVATSALGFDAVAPGSRLAAPPRGYQGAYLGLVGPSGGVQIGLAAEPAGCQALSKRLLGMDAAEPALPENEVADAVCEIVNIVAGGFKSRLRDRSPLQMGLPVFFHGPAQPTDHVAVQVVELKLGDLPAALLLVHPREAA